MRAFHLCTFAIAAATMLAPIQTTATAEPKNEETSSLALSIAALDPLSGSVRIALFDGGDGYEGDTPVAGAVVDVTGQTLTTTFEGLTPGVYGVKLFHDINGNGALDANPFGMPTEPFAFSNNARGRFGPATWEDAHFAVRDSQTTHTITMQ
ncbi:MAG: DUF2141 domain-containing protein [Pseudomonadota bacterium]